MFVHTSPVWGRAFRFNARSLSVPQGTYRSARISAAIANAFMVCSLAGMACPVHTGRGVSQRGGQAQAPHVPLFAFSPARLFSRATRRIAFRESGSDRRAYTDVLPDAACISACCLCCFGWHSYTLLSCELCVARRKTRTPCSNSLRRSDSGKEGVRPFSGGRFAYLQFTEVLVFSMICVLFYDALFISARINSLALPLPIAGRSIALQSDYSLQCSLASGSAH